MARTLYSTQFIRGVVSSPSTLTYVVPTGYVAVVRDIMLWNGGTEGLGLQGCEVYDDSFAVIFGVFYPVACVANPYNWEGRAVMNAGETLTVAPSDASWHVRCSGYLLTVT